MAIKLDVKNEARVHIWYQARFGYAIERYLSSADAIATFPTTATAVGVSRTHGTFECCAPFGLEDVFGLVCQTEHKADNTRHLRGKTERWRFIWPSLTILPWDETVSPPIIR
jgi:hypothetical protein